MTATSPYLNRPLRSLSEAESERENVAALGAATILRDCQTVSELCDGWSLDCIGTGRRDQ